MNINKKPTGIYIHVPFCRKKCIYCDFFSGGCKNVDWDVYCQAIVGEFMERLKELSSPIETIYIGGGTPSLMPPHNLSTMINGIIDRCGESINLKELTLEVNPDDVTEFNCEAWKRAGVSRVSMGIQSFIDGELKLIGRAHTKEGALNAYNILRRYFKNISLDLMFGLPFQTLENWAYNVKSVIALKPEHISAYTLMFEEGTPITILREQGKLKFPDDETVVEMWEYLSAELLKSGYIQYEISNYSLPGHESIHNKRYWTGNPYIGLGPSAHSYDGISTRKANARDIKGYMKRYAPNHLDSAHERSSGDFGVTVEKLSRKELIEEHIMTRLRMREGIDLKEFETDFGTEEYDSLISRAKDYIEKGFLHLRDRRLLLADKELMIADEIIVAVLP